MKRVLVAADIQPIMGSVECMFADPEKGYAMWYAKYRAHRPGYPRNASKQNEQVSRIGDRSQDGLLICDSFKYQQPTNDLLNMVLFAGIHRRRNRVLETAKKKLTYQVYCCHNEAPQLLTVIIRQAKQKNK